MNKWFLRITAILICLTAFPGCEPAPEPIRYGQDECVNCRMQIMDNRFGTEMVSQKGKAYKFDSIECMAAYYHKEELTPDQVHSLWVTSFDRPGELIDAATAHYLHSETLRSPMGMNLSAFSNKAAAQKAQEEYRGEILAWEQVLGLMK